MEFREKADRIKDIKSIGESLIKNADKITNVFLIYDFNDEVESKGIYHSAAGNIMTHYGMLKFMDKVIHDFITSGNVDYTNFKGQNDE